MRYRKHNRDCPRSMIHGVEENGQVCVCDGIRGKGSTRLAPIKSFRDERRIERLDM